MQASKSPAVQQVFDNYQPEYQKPLLQLRSWLLDTAENTPGVGQLEETLRWSQPSYLTSESKSGSTVRMDWFDDGKVALFFNCQTTLVESFRSMFGESLMYSKNRAIVFDINKPLPEHEIRQCMQKALTYHLDKKQAAKIG